MNSFMSLKKIVEMNRVLRKWGRRWQREMNLNQGGMEHLTLIEIKKTFSELLIGMKDHCQQDIHLRFKFDQFLIDQDESSLPIILSRKYFQVRRRTWWKERRILTSFTIKSSLFTLKINMKVRRLNIFVKHLE